MSAQRRRVAKPTDSPPPRRKRRPTGDVGAANPKRSIAADQHQDTQRVETRRAKAPAKVSQQAAQQAARRAPAKVSQQAARPTHQRRGAPNPGQNDWKNDVLPVAKDIVESYDTRVTLRQLFYRLVSLKPGEPGRLVNKLTNYNQLARNTAEARDDGTFPDLVDQTRSITVPLCWDSPADALEEAREDYRRDRTEGQPYQIWLGVEKNGMVGLLYSWFGDDLGLPIIPLGGQCSQPFRKQIASQVMADGRPAILLYAGDHDPTGWSILQNFVDKTSKVGVDWANDELPEWDTSTIPEHLGRKRGHAKAWTTIPNFNRYRKFRVALTPEQCAEYDLARNPAKAKDPNLPNFLANFGDTLTDDEVDDGLGVQVEVDALDPDDLHQLFAESIETYWDTDAYESAKAEEESDIAELDGIVEGLD